MSAKTIDYHYTHLAKNYAINYNSGKGNPRFNKAGNFLHNIFFAQFKKPDTVQNTNNTPHGLSAELINKHFGSFDKFKETFKASALQIEGSGWIYLSTDGSIKIIHNHAVRKDILLLIDWWEHAWALDYQSNKAGYLENIWSIINWDFVNGKM
jgi:Fe-Mn family superoxide dismutase